MEPAWATEHLQVIRTLMERSALYRRALAPIMFFAGSAGLVAALVGGLLRLESTIPFIAYWYGVGLLVVGGAFLMVRRQAFQQAEPFWSPPTRRVAQAMLPALTAGFALGALVLVVEVLSPPRSEAGGSKLPALYFTAGLLRLYLPLIWALLYGCAVHAAGFFMVRGIRWFGWGIILLSLAGFALSEGMNNPGFRHAVMGFFFGALHLAYGTYLYLTEPRGNEL